MISDPKGRFRSRILGSSAAVLFVVLAVIGALGFRSDLLVDPRILLVVAFALLGSLVVSMISPERRWVVSLFLVAMGLGLVAGLHSPAAFATNQARVPRTSLLP